jgi:hypoxanthine phosphoribosyltransferase
VPVKTDLSWALFNQLIDEIAGSIETIPDAIVGIARGGLPGLTALASRLQVRNVGVAFVRSNATDAEFSERLDSVVCQAVELPGAEAFDHVLLFDDIIRSGRSMDAAHTALNDLGIKSIRRAALFGEVNPSRLEAVIARNVEPSMWIRFPWDNWLVT